MFFGDWWYDWGKMKMDEYMKQTFETYDDVLGFAIHSEEQASIFYELLSKRATKHSVRKVFSDMATQELQHKETLQEILLRNRTRIFSGEVDCLNSNDGIKAIDPFTVPKIEYKDALVIAMKNEEASVKLYKSLAKAAKTKKIQEAFLALAEEEARHRVHCESEYRGKSIQVID